MNEIIKKYSNHPEFIGIDLIDYRQNSALDNTVLHLASSAGNLDDVKQICSKKNINDKGDLGNTALHYACMMGHVEIVNFLLSKGANKNLENEFGETPKDTALLSGIQNVIKAIK